MIRSPRAPLIWLLLPLLAGYAASEFWTLNAGVLAIVAAICAIVAVGTSFHQYRYFPIAWAVATWIGAFSVAASYYSHRMVTPDWEGLPPREAEFLLKTENLFQSSYSGGAVQGFARILEASPHLEALEGKRIYFSLLRSIRDQGPWPRATRIRVKGILEGVPQGDEESFQKFLRRSGVGLQMRRVEVTAPPQSPFVPGLSYNLRIQFEDYLRHGAPKELSATNIYVAMLLGKRAELSDQQRQSFLYTGTLHLFAISGLHIGVIALAIHTALALMRLPPQLAALIGLALLYIFVEITGASPSAVRAFLMVAFFWGARFVTRSPNPIAALINSAVLVLLLFPQQLWSPGFQLSYSVVSGILFLGLPLGQLWAERYRPFQYIPPALLSKVQKGIIWFCRKLIQTFAISLSATLMSSPLSIYYFEIFAPGAVVFNLILIPLASLVITAGFLSISCSLFALTPLALVFNYAAWSLISVMEGIVKGALFLPGLFWQGEYRAEWFSAACLIALIITLLAGFHRSWRPAPALCVAPFAVFILFLLGAVRLTFLPG